MTFGRLLHPRGFNDEPRDLAQGLGRRFVGGGYAGFGRALAHRLAHGDVTGRHDAAARTFDQLQSQRKPQHGRIGA